MFLHCCSGVAKVFGIPGLYSGRIAERMAPRCSDFARGFGSPHYSCFERFGGRRNPRCSDFGRVVGRRLLHSSFGRGVGGKYPDLARVFGRGSLHGSSGARLVGRMASHYYAALRSPRRSQYEAVVHLHEKDLEE